MSDQINITVDAEGLMRRFDRLPAAMQAGMIRGLKRELLLAEEDVRRNADLRFSGARSGMLSRLTSSVTRGRGAMSVEGVIGFRKTRGFPYELSQEFGAKAKAGGAMAIPVSDEAKELSARGQGPREMDGLSLVKTSSGAVLAKTSRRWANQFGSSGGGFMVHYVLVKSIRPRLHFRRTIVNARDRILAGAAAEARRSA